MATGMFTPRNRQKTAEERMKELEERTRLNRGSFIAAGEETGTNIPFMMPGRRMRSQFDTAGAQLARVQFPGAEELAIPEEYLNTELPPIGIPEMSEEPVSAEDFLNYFTEQYLAPDVSRGVATTADGGILYADGTVHYYDGTVRSGGTGDADAYPIASMPDGSVRYNDGSIRSLGQPGLFGLQEGLFGQQLPVTQEYGNINPGMGYARNVHGGIDLRTKNLAGEQRNFRLPVDTKVMEVITADSGNPYGNSVLLQLPTGEMLRFSHLGQLGNFKAGDILAAGQAFGVPGSTGKSTAEHLDLEYYDASGRRANPSQFMGFSKEQQPPQQQNLVQAQTQSQPQQQGQILGATDQQPQQQNTYQYTPPAEMTQPKLNRPLNMDYTKIQPNPLNKPGVTAANVIDVANPTGAFDLGVTESLRGNPEAGRMKQIETVENLGVGPEIGSSERSREQGTGIGRQFIGDALDTLIQKAKQMGVDVGERGITEKIAGGLTRFSMPQANASEPMQSVPAPGEGIQQLKGQPMQMVSRPARPNMADMSPSKVVGDVASGDMNMRSNSSLPIDSAQIQSRMRGYDARDPFFRQGLNQKFAYDINQDKAQSGALTLDLFNQDFYKTPEKFNQAFAGTNLFGQAQQKYGQEVESAKSRFRSQYGSDYDQGDVERILNSIPQNADLTKLALAVPKKLPPPPSDNFDFSSPSSAPSASIARSSSTPSPSAPQSTGSYSGSNSRLSQLASMVKNPGPSPAESRGFQLSPPREAANSATINRQAQQPQQSLFSSISSLLSRLFRR